MYYSATDQANLKILAGKIRNDSQMFSNLIDDDIASKRKQDMRTGTRYYQGQHDYLNHLNYDYIEEGKPQINTTRANNLVPNPFDRLLKIQKRDNIVGKPISISIAEVDVQDEKNPTPNEKKAMQQASDFQTKLLAELGDKFDDIISDVVIGASNAGVEFIHPYIDNEAKFQYVITPAVGIIPFFDMQYQDQLISVIRYYQYQAMDEKTNQLVDRYKVEWWDGMQITYWEQQVDNTWLRDTGYTDNPTFHWYDTNKTLGTKEPNGWGKPPFVYIPNNSEWSGDLTPIKPLIDAYDKVYSGLCNDLEDFQELIYIVKNMSGMNETERQGLSQVGFFLKNIKAKKVAFVEGDGDVTNLKNEIPTDAIEKFLDITSKAIYRFGQGVDTEKTDYGNLSGRALQILYAGLYSKCDSLIIKMKKALSEFMWFVVKFINDRDHTTYDYKQVVFTFNRASVVNEPEIIEGLAQTTWLSKQRMLELDPRVDNVNDELARQEAEKERDIENNRIKLDSVSDSNDYDAEGNVVGKDYTGERYNNLGEPKNNMMNKDGATA
jgi:SPP1 family phage portal protein